MVDGSEIQRYDPPKPPPKRPKILLRHPVSCSGGRIACPDDSGGGITTSRDRKFSIVNIRPPKWKDNKIFIRAENYTDAQYIADAVFYYTGSGPIYFVDAKIEYPPLSLEACELHTREACLAYVESIAKGSELKKLRADYKIRVKELVLDTVDSSPEAMLFRRREREVTPLFLMNVETITESKTLDVCNEAGSSEGESGLLGPPAGRAAGIDVHDQWTEEGIMMEFDCDGLDMDADYDGLRECLHNQGSSRFCKSVQNRIGELERQDEISGPGGHVFLGLWGVSDIGKCTLAKAVNNTHNMQFHGEVLHAEFGRVSEEELLLEALKKLSNTSYDQLDKSNKAELENGLNQRTIDDVLFLALDDNHGDDASIMQPKIYLSARLRPGSIVLVTARARDALRLVRRAYSSDMNCIQLLDGVSDDEAYALFLNHAFDPKESQIFGFNQSISELCIRPQRASNFCFQSSRFLKNDDDKTLKVLCTGLRSTDRGKWKVELLDKVFFNESKRNDPVYESYLPTLRRLLQLREMASFSSGNSLSGGTSQGLRMGHGFSRFDNEIIELQKPRASLLLFEDGVSVHDLFREFACQYWNLKLQRRVHEVDKCSELLADTLTSFNWEKVKQAVLLVQSILPGLTDPQKEKDLDSSWKIILTRGLRRAGETASNKIGGDFVISTLTPEFLRGCTITFDKANAKLMITCSATQQLQQELDIFVSLRHPLILQTMVGLSLASREQPGTITMECTEHGVKACAKSRQKGVAIDILLQIVKGVLHVHAVRRGLQAQRDLKPDNIVVSSIANLVQEQVAERVSGALIPELEVEAKSRILDDHVEPARKRFRKRNWSADEILAMLEVKEYALMMDVQPDWDYVSENLWEKYGYDRSSSSCENLWGTLLKSYKALVDDGLRLTEEECERSIGVAGFDVKIDAETLKALQHVLDTLEESFKDKLLLRKGENLRDRSERILPSKPLKDTKSIQMDTHRRFLIDLGTLSSGSKIGVSDPNREDEGLGGDSTATIKSQAEDRADQSHQPSSETNSLLAGRDTSTATDMEDDLISRIAPFVNKQIEDALEPLLSMLRSREEEEQKHRERLLVIEEEKLALRREREQFMHHLLNNSNLFRERRFIFQHPSKLGKGFIG